MVQQPSQSFDLNQFLRDGVAEMETYTPIVPFEVLSAQLGIPASQIIKLDANENPYGPSPLARHALMENPYLHIYPDPESRQLRAALSGYTNIPADHLMVGHGADELIDMVMRLCLNPGDPIINCPPTFGMYRFDAGINGAQVIHVPRRADFSLDVAGITTAVNSHPHTKLLFITSPNNPDGSVMSAAELEALLKLPLIVVLDEAYVEFYGESFITAVLDHPNLIVLRTFSKWAGLAGLRVGYGAFPLAMMTHLWKIKQPYNVNVAGQAAALASLQDAAYLQENVARIVAARAQLLAGLRQISWLSPYPSHGNFILGKVDGRQAAQVKAALAQQGILVRTYASSDLQDHLRFSVGTPAQIQQLLKALQSL